MGEPVVAVERLSFFFGSKKILDRVSFQVPAGRFTVLAGPNGVGKTTLLSCLAGFYRPQAGRVTVFGKDPWIEPQVLQRVGLAAEAPHLPPSWTLEAMAAWLFQAGRLSASGRQFLEQASVELGLFGNLAFRELSRGQKSLAQLVVTLALEPELLLLDEPFLGLDVAALDRALGLLLGFLSEHPTTVLLATQDLALAERLAEDLVMLQGAQARWCGPLAAFRERFAVVEAPTPAEGVPGARILHREQVLAGWSLVLELAEPQEFAAWLSRNGLAARRPSLGQIATVLWQR